MNQSSFIAAMLLAGFILFLAAKGRLSAYSAVLFAQQNGGMTASSTPSIGGAILKGLPILGGLTTLYGMVVP